ncbi:MAG: helix-turn-helix domain-containing protein [Luteolibacter sp.]|uniref:XRE family transcriptional regulator n=1 Tax=Luteolibacter sp. TaxID=1962973 RepID=UPI003267A312
MPPEITNLAVECVKEAMRLANFTQETLADLLGRPQSVISEILNEKRAISPELAVELEVVFGPKLCGEVLLTLQAKHLLHLARTVGKKDDIRTKARLQEEFPILEMEKRGWIPKCSDVGEKVREVLVFARQSPHLDQIIPPFESPAFARQSATLGYLSPCSRSSRAWQYRVRELAEMTPAREFDHDRFVAEGLSELRKLVRIAKGVAEVPQMLAKYGIRLVIVEHLDKTKLNGAAMWLDLEKEKMPVIALTLRYGKIDNFWFNLAHELQHIRHRHTLSIDSENMEDIEDPSLLQIEEEAERDGSNWLIPESRLRSFIERRAGRINDESILAFAEIANVHPGVLVGMLHHIGAIPYTKFSKMKIDVRKMALMSSMSDGFGQPAAKARKTL